MLDGLKPYPAYKESGVPWLGKVPEHWEIAPTASAFRESIRPSSTDDGRPILSLSYGQVIVKPLERLHGLVPKSFESYQAISPGDIIVRTTDLQNDRSSLRVGFSRNIGKITSAYLSLRTRPCVSPEFGYRLLSAYDLLKILYGYGSGLRQNLTFGDVKRMPALIPPPPEQSAIVLFLRNVDRRIRRLIQARQSLIKLLEQQKRSVFNLAISRGLESSPRTRPSGLAWIRDAPEGWDRIRLKALTEAIVDCLHATPVYSADGEFPAIRTADITPGRIDLAGARRVDAEHYRLWTARMAPAEGDILYSREGERFGIAAQVPGDVKLCISQRMMAIRVHARANARFVMWQLNCDHVYAQAAVDLIGSAAPHVNVERVRNFELLLPPRREQDRIVEWIDQRIEITEGSIRRVRQEILLLKELRTRLIADVVTGRLDVTEAASGLPLEPDIAETFAADDVEEVDVSEEQDGDAASAEADA